MMTASASAACPHCAMPLDGRPFCMRDGHLAEGERFVIGERYMVDELIGGGGFGFVFGGKHLVLGKPVAIKILREENDADSLTSKRFLREARNASQLAHENIISILDFGRCETHDVAYLVMERFVGVMLRDVIHDSAPMPVQRALPILIQLARAIAAAHTADVLHRDINPRNILVGRGDLVKLCDFGISRSLTIGDRLTASGAIMGTPAYMAPEQIVGDDPIDARVDIYGFGCTAFEMLTGRVPHGSATPAGVLANRIAGVTLETTGFSGPPELEELVLRCLSVRPDERPGAAELEAQLLYFASGSGRRRTGPDDMVQIGNYRVVRMLGRGGASTVYLGMHPVIGTKVAIKVLHPEIVAMPGMAERFIMEARTSSELGSPHIPHYYDFGTLESGQPYAVLELLEGESVAARIANNGTLPASEVLDIVRQTARAMTQVHAAGVVHRDLKPDNLFLTKTPAGDALVKILDFGIAKALVPGLSPAQTSIGLVLGTPGYCSPEQAMGLVVGPATDVFALGATAYQMLTGRLPFEGVANPKQDAPPLPDDVPRALARTIARMLARDLDARIQSMSEVLEGLAARPAEPIANVTAMRPATSLSTEPKSRARSHRWLTIAGAGVATLAVAVTVFAILRSTESKPAPAAKVLPPVIAPVKPPTPTPTPTPAPTAPAPTAAVATTADRKSVV